MQALSERDLEVLKKEQDLVLFEERIADKTRVCLRFLSSHYVSSRLDRWRYSSEFSSLKIYN